MRYADRCRQEWPQAGPALSNHEPAATTCAHYVEIPETEARRATLFTPAWVIVDEFNTDDLATSWALEDAKPLGQFTRKFMSRIAGEAAAAIRAGAARTVPRR
ncbi:hypothetical protein NKI54_30610 [Mesorhizobium sp. M0663]|uniref:hypothetical protein n=1 Tax=unclassified Mesorhizobium TaxID=325217 RepID=UPI003337DBF1